MSREFAELYSVERVEVLLRPSFRAMKTISLLAAGTLLTIVSASPATADPVDEATTALTALGSEVRRAPQTGIVRFARFPSGILVPGQTPEARAQAFLVRHGLAFGLSRLPDVTPVGPAWQDSLGTGHVRLQQRHRGIPMSGALLLVHMRGSHVIAANGRTVRDEELGRLSLTPGVSPVDAAAVARAAVSGQGHTVTGSSEPRVEIFQRGLFG